MGNKNMATQLGSAGGPMTGGQLQAMMGANQAQTGGYYSKAQQRQQDLHDTGLSMGFQRSDSAYNKGQNALDRYRQSVGDYEGADTRQQNQQTGYRNELGGYAGDEFNLGSGQANLEHGVAGSQAARKEALLGRQYGNKIAGDNATISGENASQEKKMDMLSGGAGMLSKGFGALGSAGGAAGGGGQGGNGNPQTGANGGQNGGYDPSQSGDGGNFVEQGSQNQGQDYSGNYDPTAGSGYSTSGGSTNFSNGGSNIAGNSSPGASGQIGGGMNLTGGSNSYNRMGTRSLTRDMPTQVSQQRYAPSKKDFASQHTSQFHWPGPQLQNSIQRQYPSNSFNPNKANGVSDQLGRQPTPQELEEQRRRDIARAQQQRSYDPVTRQNDMVAG